MKNLIMTGVIALSSMITFAGNGEKEIVESDYVKIENSINDVQLLDDNEPTYVYSYALWRGSYDENGIGFTWGTPLNTPYVCQTEAEMEQAKINLKNAYEMFYPNQDIWIMADIVDECN